MIGFVLALMVKSKVNVRGSQAKVNPSVCPVQRLTVCPRMTGQLLPDVNAEKTPLQIEAARVVNPSW